MNQSTEKAKFSIKNLFRKIGKASPAPSAAPGPIKKRANKKKISKIIIIVLVLAALGSLVYRFMSSSKSTKVSGISYSAATAKTMDISQTLSSSGTLKAANSYSVTSLVYGEILSADFNEGDTVTKGQTLYTIDTTDAETSIASAKLNVEKAQLSYDQAKESLANLSVTAPVTGNITALNVGVGDTVNSGATIGTIKDSAIMSLTVPFNSADVDSFYVGESAEITLDSTFETLYGTVTKISNSEQVETGNMLVKNVKIDVTNPGGITDSTTATAKIGNAACNSGATFAYKSSQAITAKTSGTVTSINYDEGDRVTKGTTLVKLESDSISQSIKNAELSLEDAENNLSNKEDALGDYTITSPIDGTVITKNYKAGDKIGASSGSASSVSGSSSGSSASSSSSSNSALCVIYDLSYLTMNMDVDELDINEIEVGQSVSIKADAVSGTTFTGTVTKVNIDGTTTNGVTAYPVTVKITDTGKLLPGMNVSAEIVVKSTSGVVGIPVDAVTRGNKVLVQKDSSKTQTNTDGTLKIGSSGIPDGFEYADVTLGISNDNNIEVVSGLSDGDVIAVSATASSSSSTSKSSDVRSDGDGGDSGGDMSGGPGGDGGGGGPVGG